MRKLLWIPVVLLVSLPACVIGGARLAVSLVEAGDEAPATPRKGEQELLADAQRLHDLGILVGRGTASDAAPELNALFDADGEIGGTNPAWWAEHDAFAKLIPYKSDMAWLDHPEVTSTYDVSFLAGWAKYDHWAWDESPPYSTWYAAHPEQPPAERAIPNFIPIQFLVKVRLAQAFANGDLPAAMAEVDHLAVLMASTDLLVGGAIGSALLGIEEGVYEKALALGKLQPDPNRRYTKEDLKGVKLVLFGFFGAWSGTGTEPFLKSVAQDHADLMGVCAGLAEGAMHESILRDVAEHPWPGEVDQSERIRAVTEALTVTPCRIAAARAIWATPERAREWRTTGALAAMGGDRMELGLEVPYVRSPILAKVLQIEGVDGGYGTRPPGS